MSMMDSHLFDMPAISVVRVCQGKMIWKDTSFFTPESANFPVPSAQLDLCLRAILTSMWGVTLARGLTTVIFPDAWNHLPSKVTLTSIDAYILKTKGSNVNNANTNAYRAQIWRTTCWSTWIPSLSSAEYVQKHFVKRTSWKSTSKGSTHLNQ